MYNEDESPSTINLVSMHKENIKWLKILREEKIKMKIRGNTQNGTLVEWQQQLNPSFFSSFSAYILVLIWLGFELEIPLMSTFSEHVFNIVNISFWWKKTKTQNEKKKKPKKKFALHNSLDISSFYCRSEKGWLMAKQEKIEELLYKNVG